MQYNTHGTRLLQASIGDNRLERREEDDSILVNGKTLKEWATKEPHRLEKMFEHEFDTELREAMSRVWAKYNMEDK